MAAEFYPGATTMSTIVIPIRARGPVMCTSCTRMAQDGLQRAWCLPLEASAGSLPGLGAVLCCNARADGAECGPAGAMHQADDVTVLARREAQRHVRPYWMFAPRPSHCRPQHPLAATTAEGRRP